MAHLWSCGARHLLARSLASPATALSESLPRGRCGLLLTIQEACSIECLLVHLQMMKDVMGPYQDIPGPEMSTGSKVSMLLLVGTPNPSIINFALAALG